MDRTFKYGGAMPAGANCARQFDPAALPIAFEARDARADGHVRRVEIARDRVVVRRAVRGIQMKIQMRIADFLGVALRANEGADDAAGHAAPNTLMLEHRDPALSIPLLVADEGLNTDEETLAAQWKAWAEAFSLPQLVAASDGSLHNPYQRSPSKPRRRRTNVLFHRRPSILMRRKPRALLCGLNVYDNEREIIARN